jgi:Hsp70 protein
MRVVMILFSLQPVEAAMVEADVTPANIDRVLLAGGMSRMPKLKDTISALFPTSCAIETKTNPEETVASGAAIAACLQSKLTQLEENESGAAAIGSKHGKGKGKPQKPASSEGEPAHVLGDTVALHHLSASVGAVHSGSKVHVAVHRLALLPATGSCTVAAPVVDRIATVTIVQGDDFENPSANLALCTMPLPVKSSEECVDVTVTIGVTKHGGVLVRAALADGTQSTVHIPHGHEHAPLGFDDVSAMGVSEPPAVAVAPPEPTPDPVPVTSTPIQVPATPSPAVTPVAASAPAPVPVVATAPPAPATKPIIAADDLD